jgi:hypothetical protein
MVFSSSKNKEMFKTRCRSLSALEGTNPKIHENNYLVNQKIAKKVTARKKVREALKGPDFDEVLI